MDSLGAETPYGTNATLSIDSFPDTCPICHNGIKPIEHSAYWDGNTWAQAIFRCPLSSCDSLFIAHYYVDMPGSRKDFYLAKVTPQTLEIQEFSSEINTVSPIFAEIFNQAFNAESYGLDQVCGCGYRKALEFLIKDYAISKSPTSKDDIEKKLLGSVIKDFVDDIKVKRTAELAAWLGNDETHYKRKWTELDIKDLKQLIKITVNWIENEIMMADYESRMKPN